MRAHISIAILGGFIFVTMQALSGTPTPSVNAAEVSAAGNGFAVADEAAFFACLRRTGTEMSAGLFAAIDARDWPQAKSMWADYLQARQRPAWLWSHRDLPAMKALFATHFGGFDAAVPEADKILAREFTFEGVTKTLASHPDWTPTKNEWTNLLNRHGYFRILGLAYWATGDERYARDFVDLLEDRIASNPVPAEVNESWARFGTSWRTLETGIRIHEWLNDLQLFMDAPAFDAEAKYQMSRSLIEHARRLYERNDAFHQGNAPECPGWFW